MSANERKPRSVVTGSLLVFLAGLAIVFAFVGFAAGQNHPTGSTPQAAAEPTTTESPDPVPASAPSHHMVSKAPKATAYEPYDAVLPPVGPGKVHEVRLSLKDVTIEIAPGVKYTAWTFSGGAPGPVIHVRQGDRVNLTLKNDGAIPHSIDFHAARIAPNRAFKDVAPGESIKYSFTASDPGVFMYHCGTPPVLAHIANGMYGAIVVDPKGGLPKVDRSYVLVGSEWYMNGDGIAAPATIDMNKARHMQPDWVTWNGYAGQYKDHPLPAKTGETVRFYVVAAGPSFDLDFHIVGTLLDKVWLDGTTTNTLRNVQTQLVPAGGGMVFDTSFRENGLYPFVSHSFASVDMGQVGLVNVGNVHGTMSH